LSSQALDLKVCATLPELSLPAPKEAQNFSKTLHSLYTLTAINLFQQVKKLLNQDSSFPQSKLVRVWD
jgi:hypothetical protein